MSNVINKSQLELSAKEKCVSGGLLSRDKWLAKSHTHSCLKVTFLYSKQLFKSEMVRNPGRCSYHQELS